MNETITANGVIHTVKNVTTGIDTISFTLTNPMDNPEAEFREVKSITVGDSQENVYGQYPDVEYESLTIFEDRSVTVTMHILTRTEKRIKELETTQAEQDEAIAAMMFGGEE